MAIGTARPADRTGILQTTSSSVTEAGKTCAQNLQKSAAAAATVGLAYPVSEIFTLVGERLTPTRLAKQPQKQ